MIIDRSDARGVMTRWLALVLTGAVALLAACGDDDGTQTDAAVDAAVVEDAALDAAVDATTDASVPAGRQFPSGFLFGTATAGFQVEPGCPTVAVDECTDPLSDWYVYATDATMIAEPNTFLTGQDPAEVGPGHYELYETDFDNVTQELHNNAFRMSLEWSRIFPTSTEGVTGYANLLALADPTAVAHYHDVFAALKARGITPLVTINHYTLPTWIHDPVGCHANLASCSPRGWVDAERTVTEMAKFAGFVAAEYGDDVDHWCTLNEPHAVLLPGFLAQTPSRTNPPAVSFRSAEAKIALNAMIQAHARIYDAIHEADLEDADADGVSASVGIVYNIIPTAAQDPQDPAQVTAAENMFYLFNEVMLNAMTTGRLDHDLDGTAELDATLENRMDYLGLNYYYRMLVKAVPQPFLPDYSPLTTFNPVDTITDDQYPQGMYDSAMYLHATFGKPIIVTESGVAVTEDLAAQSRYVVQYLSWIHQAMQEGADIRGYFFWALMDNFEWNHGMDQKK
jgi:beta-galactosidase